LEAFPQRYGDLGSRIMDFSRDAFRALCVGP